MKKEDYITPDENWLKQQFKDIPFGIMRPSEMETILSFFVIYHNEKDIEKTEEDISQKYKIAESKARRLKIEFASRYRKNGLGWRMVCPRNKRGRLCIRNKKSG